MHIVIFVTVPDKKQARQIANKLIKTKLAACVNIIPGVESLFSWKGKIDSAKELLLVIKSEKSKLPKIIKTVKSLHSYEVPEIIALPIIAGNKEYLRWIDECIR
ncbi:MAG: hypothetical protein A2166_04015 [Omnitrophica WOR_2 bacterium RBG_13_41_10]|nr:MAG: hypothetical protein A2166_04015 [Omnitrophica WOR_2 bacterium RBG_13_41_10]